MSSMSYRSLIVRIRTMKSQKSNATWRWLVMRVVNLSIKAWLPGLRRTPECHKMWQNVTKCNKNMWHIVTYVWQYVTNMWQYVTICDNMWQICDNMWHSWSPVGPSGVRWTPAESVGDCKVLLTICSSKIKPDFISQFGGAWEAFQYSECWHIIVVWDWE